MFCQPASLMEGSGANNWTYYGSGSGTLLARILYRCTCITGVHCETTITTQCVPCVFETESVSAMREGFERAASSLPAHRMLVHLTLSTWNAWILTLYVLHLPTRIQNRTNSSENCMAFQRHFFMWVCLLWLSPMRERVGVAVGHTLLVGGLPVH
jgi:hypothetical protein